MKATVIDFKNDYEGTMEIGFSTGEVFSVKYDPMGFGIGIFKLMIESCWAKFEGTPKDFVEAFKEIL